MGNIIINRPLEMGEVLTIRSDSGTTLKILELLFSPNTLANFTVNKQTNKVDFIIDNTDLKYQDLSCSLDKRTLKDLYVNIRELYNQLEEESEENK